MTENYSKRNRAITLIIMSVITLWIIFQMQSSTIFAGNTYSYTRIYISGGGDITSQFHVLGMTGLCQNGHKASPTSGKTKMQKLSSSEIRTKLVYHYGYKKNWISGTNGCRLARSLYYSVSGIYYHQSKSVINKMISTAKKVNVPEWFEAYVCTPEDGYQSFVAWRYREPGQLYLKKMSTVPKAQNTGSYSFKGIKYGVYSDKKCKNKIKDITCDKTGVTQTIKLKEGSYYLKETKAAGGYQINSIVYTAKLISGKKTEVKASDVPQPGKVTIKKEFTDDSDKGAVLKGFNFKLVNIKDNSIICKGTTDKEGKVTISGVLAGNYRITEEMTAEQLKENEDITQSQNVQIVSGKEKTCVWKNRHIKNRRLKIIKKMGDNRPAGGFTFEIIGENIEKKQIKTSEKSADNDVIILEKIRKGKYTVTEKMTDIQKLQYYQPEPVTGIVGDNTGEDDTVFTFKNIPKWTSVKLKKKSDDGQIEGVAFRITGKNVFDENVDIQALTDSDGIADFGHLYRGSYLLEETDFDIERYFNTYKTEGYKNRQCLKFDITGTEDDTVWLGSSLKDSKDETVFLNKLRTRMLFTKLDGETKEFLPGAQFKVLNDKGDTVAVFETTEDRDINGNPIAGAKIISSESKITVMRYDELSPEDQEKTLKEEKQIGLAINQSKFIVLKGFAQGEKYVIEEIKAPEGYSPGTKCVIRKIQDLDSYVLENSRPEIATSASEKATGKKYIVTDGTDNMVEIVDTVDYKRLVPGKKYRLSGKLMDKNGITSNNAEDIKNLEINGKLVSEVVEFIPEKSEGSVDVVFRFDAGSLDQCSAVVFEELFDGDVMIANHMEYDSQEQSIVIKSKKPVGHKKEVEKKHDRGKKNKVKADVAAGDVFRWSLMVIAMLAIVCTVTAAVLYKNLYKK